MTIRFRRGYSDVGVDGPLAAVARAQKGITRAEQEFSAAQEALARAHRREEYNTRRLQLVGRMEALAADIAELDVEYEDVI